MAINIAAKYSPLADQAFKHGLYTGGSTNNKYEFTGVDTVKVYTLTTQAPVDYDATDDSDRYGGISEMQDTTKSYQVTTKKAFKLGLDKINQQDTAGVRRAGELLALEIKEQILPLIDKDVLATAATGASAVSQTIDYNETTPFDNFLSAGVLLDEAEAPTDGRYAFVTPTYYKQIKLDDSFILPSEMNAQLLRRGVVGQVDGTVIIKVPTAYFPAGVKGLLWHKNAILGVRKLSESRIVTDSEMMSGSLLLGLFRFNSFVLEAKKKAVAAIVDTASAS